MDTLEAPMKKGKWFIVKPDAGSQGDGIFLTNSYSDLVGRMRATSNSKSFVVQRYLPHPVLIDGCKFDIRLYVLVTSLEPLQVYLAREGLVRLCVEKYCAPKKTNMHKTMMHMTNYSLNKKSDDFKHANMEGHESGSKRPLSSAFRQLQNDGYDIDALW
jgi:tubulin polyglutamylase TTLL11